MPKPKTTKKKKVEDPKPISILDIEPDDKYGIADFFPMEVPKVNFENVGGMDKLKEEARLKIILPFKKPELFKRFKKKIGGGIMLYGPPGCGKTHFARCLAGECKVNFFNVGISQVVNMWFGNSEKNITNLFKIARENKPAIVFFDEIDALGRSREHLRFSAGSNMINQFLNELDGVDTDNENLLIIGATNMIWNVDPALQRPGRFETILFVSPPDIVSREAILKLYTDGLPIDSIDYKEIVDKTSNFSGADLRNLCEKTSDKVLKEIIEKNVERNIIHKDFIDTLINLKATTLEWLDIAEHYAKYSNVNGKYDDLVEYLKGYKSNKKIGFASEPIKEFA